MGEKKLCLILVISYSTFILQISPCNLRLCQLKITLPSLTSVSLFLVLFPTELHPRQQPGSVCGRVSHHPAPEYPLVGLFVIHGLQNANHKATLRYLTCLRLILAILFLYSPTHVAKQVPSYVVRLSNFGLLNIKASSSVSIL